MRSLVLIGLFAASNLAVAAVDPMVQLSYKHVVNQCRPHVQSVYVVNLTVKTQLVVLKVKDKQGVVTERPPISITSHQKGGHWAGCADEGTFSIKSTSVAKAPASK